MLRLFVAIPLPEDVTDDLLRICSGIPGARWLDASAFHVTLRFIGEVDGGAADDVFQALGRLRSPAFPMLISGVGCFESGGKVHTLWAGVEKSDLLVRIRDKVDVAVTRAGLPTERRKFKPHITLARFRNGVSARIGSYLERHNGLQVGPVWVSQFTLFRSHLGSDGAHYERLADYDLSGPDAEGRRLNPP
ncbi:MAG: RNA 2',3'-cyclic phosphodiesterase [Rhodospirillales bacterium]|nr:RNA 2',3'-cyclic phosphodiesterase [Rhodospirillales bacterium]